MESSVTIISQLMMYVFHRRGVLCHHYLTADDVCVSQAWGADHNGRIGSGADALQQEFPQVAEQAIDQHVLVPDV